MKQISFLIAISLFVCSCDKKNVSPDYTGVYTASYTQTINIGTSPLINRGITEIQVKKGSTSDRLLFTDKTIGSYEVKVNGTQFTHVDGSYTQISGQFISDDEFTYTSATSIPGTQSSLEVRGKKQ